jgi:hypothetical protein
MKPMFIAPEKLHDDHFFGGLLNHQAGYITKLSTKWRMSWTLYLSNMGPCRNGGHVVVP